MRGLALFECIEVGVNGITVFAGLAQRAQQQFGIAVRARALLPRQQLRLVAPRGVAQPRHDDYIEFKPLGFMNGHQLQTRVGLCISGGKKFGHLRFECAEVEYVAALFQRFEQAKVRLRVVKISAFGHARRAAQRQPRAFDPACCRHASP